MRKNNRKKTTCRTASSLFPSHSLLIYDTFFFLLRFFLTPFASFSKNFLPSLFFRSFLFFFLIYFREMLLQQRTQPLLSARSVLLLGCVKPQPPVTLCASDSELMRWAILAATRLHKSRKLVAQSYYNFKPFTIDNNFFLLLLLFSMRYPSSTFVKVYLFHLCYRIHCNLTIFSIRTSRVYIKVYTQRTLAVRVNYT